MGSICDDEDERNDLIIALEAQVQKLMFSQETLLRQHHLLRVNNEICCDSNLKVMSELKVAINHLKWMTIGDETINDLLGIRNHLVTCVNWFI